MPSPEELVRMRIQGNLPPSNVAKFDPLIAIALAGLVVNIFRACAEHRARKTLMQARRQPTGRAASRIRSDLATQYQAKYPSMPSGEVGEYVEASMKSLYEAEQEELDVLLLEAQDAPER